MSRFAIYSASAGSGKTYTLVRQYIEIAISSPSSLTSRFKRILAITFTNKAAQEMRERACSLVGAGSVDLWISTFHATCSRILRRFIDRIGYDRNFTIYDTSDQKTLMKEVIKSMNLDTKMYPERDLTDNGI